MMNWLRDDGHQIDAKEAETYFKTKFPIFSEVEEVQIAFKDRQNFKLFTNMRLLFVHVKGLIEKRIEFVTIMYSSIHSFSVESAGLFKRYTEMR